MRAQGGSATGFAAVNEGLAAVRTRWWLVVALAALGLLAGYLLSSSNDETAYEAWLTSQPLGNNRSVTEIGISTPEGPLASDFLEGTVSERIERKTGLSHDFIIAHLLIDQPPNGGPNPPISLTTEAGSAEEARRLMTVWLATIREVRAAKVQRTLDRGERGLEKDLKRAQRRGQPASQRLLAELLARMRPLRATLSVDYAITQRPRPQTTTSSHVRSAGIGMVGGLVAGILLALAVALADGRIRTKEGLEAALGVELLADLRAGSSVPSAEHAKRRLRAIAGGDAPATLTLVPCGRVDSARAVTRVGDALGHPPEVSAVDGLRDLSALAEESAPGTWAIVAEPGAARRDDVAALNAETSGIGSPPAGVFVV